MNRIIAALLLFLLAVFGCQTAPTPPPGYAGTIEWFRNLTPPDGYPQLEPEKFGPFEREVRGMIGLLRTPASPDDLTVIRIWPSGGIECECMHSKYRFQCMCRNEGAPL